MKRPFLRKLLRAYKPLDMRLRRFGPYARMSRRLQKSYSIFMSGGSGGHPGVSSGQRGDAAATAYIQNYDIIQPRQDTILFECYWGRKVGCNPLAMYRALVASQPQGAFRIYWTLAADVVAPPEIAMNPDVIIIRGNKTAQYGIALLEAGYLVNNVTFPTYFIRRPGQRYCNTWHGVPMKAMGRDMAAPFVSMANSQRNFLQADVLLSMGDFYRGAAIRPYYVDQLVETSVLPCGAPRVDDVLHPKVAEATLRQGFGIGETQKVVLFAPTWRGNSTEIAPDFADQAQIYLHLARTLGPEYFVLFSAHQMVTVSKADRVDNGALLPDDANINDVLTIVDILVSDYSSILFDFLPLDRPIVLFTPDIDQYRTERGLYVEPKDLPSAEARDLDSLIAAIRAERRPSSFADHQAECARFIPLEDGAAARTALQALLTPAEAITGKAEGNRRKRLLIGPGGMVPNGITTSLKNMIANLDYDRYDPYILIDVRVMDNDELRRQQFQDFDPRCNWILRTGDMMLTKAEAAIYNVFRQGDETVSDEDLQVIRAIFARESRRILGDAEFDVAIEFGGYAPYWSALIACSNSRRKVVYQHNHLWAEYSNQDVSRNQRQLYGVFLTYRWFDEIVAVSDETRKVNQQHLEQFYPEGLQARTVRNTMNLRRVQEMARRPLDQANPDAAALFDQQGLFRFIALGRLSPEKRYDRMIGAFAQIAPTHPNARLVICGKGPLQDQLEALAIRLGVGDRVRFLGLVANPYPLLAAADVCVMSSDYEGQPMALLEALCLEKVCIGSDIPGIRAVLKDGCGHIVAPTEEAFAEAMKAAIEGQLPPLAPANINDDYIARTMRDFYQVVCGEAD